MFVLDTDHVSILQRAESDAAIELRDRLDASSIQVVTSIVSAQEQVRGRLSVLKRNRDVRADIYSYERLKELFDFYANWILLPWNEAACDAFEDLKQQRIRVSTMDLKIASIAIANDAVLLTRNTRDFERVPDLEFENWLD